jgi:hypothetical protein
MTAKTVVSLYDFTGIAVVPWAEAGYTCYCFDIAHDATPRTVSYDGGGSIVYRRADLHNKDNFTKLLTVFKDTCCMLMAFPVCTDMAVSGAAWFAAKGKADPEFQNNAVAWARWCAELGDDLGVPYFIENPVSVLATMWRKPDFRFDPWQFGGYIPEADAAHPRWPDHIAPRDAYPKRTCLWTGNGFVFPALRCVSIPTGYSTQHNNLGGKSKRTKDIRSATPRGFTRAVFSANSHSRTVH